ncbi:MAG: DUF2282 domain-containing protein [Rhodospirillales bacterium]|nr:DUF2282 domain-containing protein [Rhodospirillales bacterium]
MKTTIALAAAVGAGIALALATGATQAQEAKTEKCYGVAKAGKNDCQTATSSCAGTSKRDAQADAWVGLPAGVCAKIVGGVVK